MHDAIVIGLGAVGSATAWQLAKRGARVLGIDRFAPPHAHGSSHGDTRITRKAIGEGEAYVPLVLRSCDIVRELEARTGESLLGVTGGLWISSDARLAETHVPDFFRKTLAAAARFGIAHEVLDAAGIRARFPQFAVRDNERGYFEPDAGYLRPEACVAAQLRLAREDGAEIRTGERVEAIAEDGGSVTVRTDRGEHRARQAIVCAGAWVGRFLPGPVARLFTLTRQVQHWFDVEGAFERHSPPSFPVFIWELQDRRNVIYGFPAVDGPRGGLKVATERYDGPIPDADGLQPVLPEESAAMHAGLVAPFLPGVGPRCVKAVPCLYTATPDFHFVVDRHPAMPRVTIASPCSGHGFKHSPAMGEALARRVLDEAPDIDLAPFALARFAR